MILLYIGASTLAAPKISKIDTSDGMTLIADGKVEQAKITEGVQRVDLTLAEDFTKGDDNLGKLVQFNYVVPQGEAVVDRDRGRGPRRRATPRWSRRPRGGPAS